MILNHIQRLFQTRQKDSNSKVYIFFYKRNSRVSLCWLRAAEGTSIMTFSSKKKSGLFVEAKQKAMGHVNSLSQIRENI